MELVGVDSLQGNLLLEKPSTRKGKRREVGFGRGERSPQPQEPATVGVDEFSRRADAHVAKGSQRLALERSPVTMGIVFDQEQAAFLGSQACVWGAYFVQSGIRYLVGKMLRSDRYGNQWVYDPTYKKRKGWRGISPKQYDKLCSHVCLFVSCCQHLVKKYRTAEEFEAKVCKVNKYQWARRNIFLEGRESTCGMTEFQKWTRNTHKELKPLR